MLDLAILGLLKEQDLHGYELKKRLSETLGVASGVSFGSLYPALARLERAGAVSAVALTSGPSDRTRSRVVMPSTGSLGGEMAAWRTHASLSRPSGGRSGARTGRSRKVYGITAVGDQLFEELLAAEESTGDDSRSFHLRLAFARYLDADARLGMLERRRAQLLERLTRVRSGTRTGRRIDGYVRSLIEHDCEAAEHDLSWIERLIAREHATAGQSPATVGAPSPATGPGPARRSSPQERTPSPRAIAPPTLSGLRPAASPGLRPASPSGLRPAPPSGLRPASPSGLRPAETEISGPLAPGNQEESSR